MAEEKPRKKKEEKQRGSRLARKFFPEARIIPMTRKEHDRTMAVVLSLTHLLNIVYAGTASRSSLRTSS